MGEVLAIMHAPCMAAECPPGVRDFSKQGDGEASGRFSIGNTKSFNGRHDLEGSEVGHLLRPILTACFDLLALAK